jgi:hypothetical protein
MRQSCVDGVIRTEGILLHPPYALTFVNGPPSAQTLFPFGPAVALQQPDRQDFPLAVLLSTGSRTVTAGYRTAPFQGWSVPTPPDAVGGALLILPVTAR